MLMLRQLMQENVWCGAMLAGSATAAAAELAVNGVIDRARAASVARCAERLTDEQLPEARLGRSVRPSHSKPFGRDTSPDDKTTAAK